MKILQITSSFLPVAGGMENVVASISRVLVKRGHEVTVLTTDLYAKKALAGEERIDGIQVIRCKNDSFAFGYGFSSSFRSTLKRIWREFDVIHVHGYNRFASEYALFYLRRKRPTVFTAHGFIHTGVRNPLKRLHEHTLGKVVRFASVCTSLSPLDRLYFQKLGVKDERIVDVPNGVDVARFSCRPPSPRIAHLRKQWGVKRGESVVLFVGRVHESKGLSFLVEAISRIPNARLVIVGPDAGFSSHLRAKANSLGVSSRIVLTGPLADADLPVAFHSAEVFSMPSEMEGFGLAIVEAMAAGLPVVASDRGAIPLLVRDGENGFTIPYGDAAALSEKLSLLIFRPALRRAMGKKGQNLASRLFSWKHVVDLLEGIYGKLAPLPPSH